MDLSLKIETDHDRRVITLWLSQPQKPVVVLDRWLLSQIDLALDHISKVAAAGQIKGFILRSESERVFVAGADLNEIGGLDDAQLLEYLKFGQHVFNRIEALPCVSVACINGDALGGGLEIALACQYRVAAAAKGRNYRIGLPEARLGILPGWGGTQRLPAIVQPSIAIGHISTGRTFTPGQALEAEVIDALVEPEQLAVMALDFIDKNPKRHRARIIQKRRDEVAAALEWARTCPDLSRRFVRRLPSARKVVEAVSIGLSRGLQSGLDAEADFLVELRSSIPSQGMIHAFFARGSVQKRLTQSLTEAAAPTQKIAIIGKDLSACPWIKPLSTKHEVRTYASVGDIPAEARSSVEVFIEAAGDDRTQQMAMLRAVSAVAGDETLILTTSPVLAMQDVLGSVAGGKRLAGWVPGRPGGNQACEIVRGAETTDATVGAALALCRSIGRIPLMQNEGGPTVLTRLFGELVIQAWNLATDCGDPGMIDRSAVREGFTVGPLHVLDRMGVGRSAGLLNRLESVKGIESVFDRRFSWRPSDSFLKKCGNRPMDQELLHDCFFNILVETGSEILAEQRVAEAEDIWTAAVFGLGLSPARFDLVAPIDSCARAKMVPSAG